MKIVRLSVATAAVLLGIRGGALGAQTPPCCSITAIDAATGVVSGKVASNNNVFAFKIANARTLTTLKVGQAIYVNFTTRQVSLDGRAACCTVSSGPTPPAVPAPVTRARTTPPPAPAPVPPPASQPPPNSTSGTVPTLGGKTSAISLALPPIAYGTPHAPTLTVRDVAIRPRYESRPVTTVVGGRSVTNNIVHLRGLDGIEQAPGLPEGARRLLKMHVRKLKPGESDHYIVNLELANQWMAAHPAVPSDVQPADENTNTHSGCSTWSMHCAGEVVKHAEGQADQLIQQAQDAWNHASGEMAKDWNTVEACFADASLPLQDVPVKFTTSPGMTVDLSSNSSSKLSGGGSTSTTVRGSLGLSFPMQSDFTSELDLFYIPCLPFVVRPKQISAGGTFTIGEDLTASASASGAFDKTFTIPPTGGPRIPVEVIPIVIAGVPVAEMDVSVYIEGDVAVKGKGTIAGQFEVKNPHKAAFNFSCGGSGCSGSSRGIPDPTTATESASLKGTLSVRPDIYTAIQLDFDIDALSARAGPQPYLLGEAAGCVAVAGSQSSAAASTESENHLLTADLDWGVDLRAEALVAGKVVGNSWTYPVTHNKHLWFRDLVPDGSTGLEVLVTPVAQAVVNRPAAYKMRMPSCYPYTGAVRYQVSWTGGGSPAATPACAWQANQGTCNYDPTRDLTFAIAWPTAGSHTLTVVAVGDSHDNSMRTFAPAPKPTQLTVMVTPGG